MPGKLNFQRFFKAGTGRTDAPTAEWRIMDIFLALNGLTDKAFRKNLAL
jgi:hypothetical protein